MNNFTGFYQTADGQSIEIVFQGDDLAMIYPDGQKEVISMSGHMGGWWHTESGSISFGDNFCLISKAGDMLGENAIKYNKVISLSSQKPPR